MVSACGEVVLNHVGVDEVILAAGWNCWLHKTCHHRSVLADEICHVGHVGALLEQQVAALQIGGEQAELVIPCVLAVEFVAKPRNYVGNHVFVALRHIHVQQ